MLADPTVELSKVIRKRSEQAELKAYLAGLSFTISTKPKTSWPKLWQDRDRRHRGEHGERWLEMKTDGHHRIYAPELKTSDNRRRIRKQLMNKGRHVLPRSQIA